MGIVRAMGEPRMEGKDNPLRVKGVVPVLNEKCDQKLRSNKEEETEASGTLKETDFAPGQGRDLMLLSHVSDTM